MQHVLIFDVGSAERHSLVEYGQCVTHRSVSFACYDMQRLVIYGDVLLDGDAAEVADDVRDADSVEIIGLAS